MFSHTYRISDEFVPILVLVLINVNGIAFNRYVDTIVLYPVDVNAIYPITKAIIPLNVHSVLTYLLQNKIRIESPISFTE